MSSPMFLRLFFFEFEKRKPKSINGTASIEMSALNPNHDTIHAVIVVPMLAPMITPMACVSVSSPAFTKLTTMTVVADDDCIMEVMPRPVITPLNGFDVIADRNPRSLSPAAFCNPELIRFIPYRNIPNAPKSVNSCNIFVVRFFVRCKGKTKMFQKCFKTVRLWLKSTTCHRCQICP